MANVERPRGDASELSPEPPDAAFSTKMLRDQGIDGDAIARRVGAGELIRRTRGIYVPNPSSTSNLTTSNVTTSNVLAPSWRSNIAAELLRSGPGAVVGLRSAARLHGLDGFAETTALDTLTANPYHQGAVRVHRTRTLLPTDVMEIDGLPVTTLARTLFDLGRVCSADEVELALESALRGDDLKRPDIWDEELLADLWERVRVRRPRTGASVLFVVLQRRPVGCRPTGSYAETKLLQGLRREGVDVVRQCEVLLVDAHGNITARFFVDFAVPPRLAIVEVNGAQPRQGATMTAADVDRMNLLMRTFRFHVVAGTDAVHRPGSSARTVKAVIDNEPVHPSDSIVRGHRVRVGPLWMHVIELES